MKIDQLKRLKELEITDRKATTFVRTLPNAGREKTIPVDRNEGLAHTPVADRRFAARRNRWAGRMSECVPNAMLTP
jgi:hypothetical protein